MAKRSCFSWPGSLPFMPSCFSFFSQKGLPIKKLWKKHFIGYLVACVTLFALTFLTATVLGPEVTGANLYPGFTLAERIDVGNVISRLESLLFVIFFITVYLKLAMYLSAVSITAAKVMNIKNYKPLSLPFGIIFILLSLTEFNNLNDDSDFYFYGSMVLIVSIDVVLPLFMFAVGVVQRKRKRLPIFPVQASKQKQ
ncbi:hypothetical protein DT065_16140 [Salicibibacter kimchii]|uniref:Uncharacterized protein n=1 Tax=Salicibibacter kimchii TaxID=2099786 RepID=A0A345C2E0_9BACI|nr:hypothetical protein DT065_16140 [Salicibibacter kimchii]